MIDVVDQALLLLKKESEPEVKICYSSAYWIPFVWLYDELKKNKDIVVIRDLPQETKKELWKLVCRERPEKDRYIKVLIVQAIHAYNTVTR